MKNAIIIFHTYPYDYLLTARENFNCGEVLKTGRSKLSMMHSSSSIIKTRQRENIIFVRCLAMVLFTLDTME